MNQVIHSHSDLVSYHRDQHSLRPNNIDLGKRLYRLRTERGVTISELARAVGLSSRQLQNIETGTTSPRIEQLQPILAALGVDFDRLFSMRDERAPLNRRTLTPVNAAMTLSLQHYQHQLLCTELLHKKMLPLITVLKPSAVFKSLSNGARTWEKHDGEVLLLVLRGQVTLVGELYQPLLLQLGDSVYFDGSTPYQLYNEGKLDAEVTWLTSIC